MRLPVRFSLLLGMALAPVGATAAPQMLGLIATGAPIPLVCSGTVCTGELSAFCLQKDRATPPSGTAYRLVAGRLNAITAGADGAPRRIALDDAKFESLRGMSAVRVTIDRRALPAPSGVALEVSADTSLVPVPDSRAARPLTPAEIAEASGVLRTLGTQIIDRSPEAQVLRGLNEALNPQPGALAPSAGDADGPAAAEIRGCARQVAYTRSLRSGTIGIYGYWTGRGIGHEPSLRACVEAVHDSLARRLTEDYWDAKDSFMY